MVPRETKVPGGPEIEGIEGLFSDTAAGPEVSSHEIFLGARYNRGQRFVSGRMLGNRNFSLRGGYFVRLYTMGNRRFDRTETVEEDESMSGFSADVNWLVSEGIALRGQYEIARDSNLLYPHLGDFQSVTGRVEVSF